MYNKIEQWEVEIQRNVQNIVKDQKSILLICMFFKYLISVEFLAIISYVVYWSVPKILGIKLIFITSISIIINGIAKFFFVRPRPFWKYKHIKCLSTVLEEDFSYPSGHAQCSAQFLYTLVYIYNYNNNILMLLICTIISLSVGFSRVILGVHYFSDVVSGWILGIIITNIILKFELFDMYVNNFNSLERTLLGIILIFFVFISMNIIKSIVKIKQKDIQTWKLNAYNNYINKNKTLLNQVRIAKRSLINRYVPLFGVLIGIIYTFNFIKEYDCTDNLYNSKLYSWFKCICIVSCLHLSQKTDKTKFKHVVIYFFIHIWCGVVFIN